MNAYNFLLNIPSQKIKYGLSRTKKLLKACGNPEKKICSIQIIGTNGKGSVSAFLANILIKNNYNVGLFTSPHLVDVNERIRINLKPISNKDIQKFIEKYMYAIKKIKPSFFELCTAMALWNFSNKKVDFAILETGLGGRLDSVTACHNKYLVFTPISMDHHQILGNNIEKISLEKAGAIFSPSQDCFSSQQNQITKKILNSRSKKYNIQINYYNQDKEKEDIHQPKNLFGEHQKNNALLAKFVINHLKEKKVINISQKIIYKAIHQTQWPGRFQTISKNPHIIYDVCHNADSITAFRKTLDQYHNNKKFKYLICGFEDNKKIKTELNKIKHFFNKIVCTETGIRSSMNSKELEQSLSSKKTINIPNINEAFSYVLNQVQKTEVIFIIGSHFFAPSINKRFKNCFAIHK